MLSSALELTCESSVHQTGDSKPGRMPNINHDRKHSQVPHGVNNLDKVNKDAPDQVQDVAGQDRRRIPDPVDPEEAERELDPV